MKIKLCKNAVYRYAVPLICENCFRKILENSQSAREGGRGGSRGNDIYSN